jgi:mandelamide amidase
MLRICLTLLVAALPVSAVAQERPLTELSATEIVGGITSGAFTATDVVEAALEAAERTKSLNAFITVDEDGARAAAAAVDEAIAAGEPVGPLAGVPLVVKDNIVTAGIRTTAGTPALKDFVPAQNALLLQPLLDGGAILVGKTNLHELAFGITSNNATYGAVGNPVAPDRFAGGSSGGTAAAIAAGVAPLGIGTDTGGSVRIPAALTGIVGLRPTVGRYPQGGIMPISTTRDTAGPMGRTVADVALLDGVITGDTAAVSIAPLAMVRLGLASPQVDDLSPGVRAVFDAAVARLEAAGATIVPVDMSEIVQMDMEAGFPIALFEARRDITSFLEEFVPGMTVEAVAAAIASPDVKAVFDNAILGETAMPEVAYIEAMEEIRPVMQEAYNALLEEEGLDAIIFPTTPLEAQPIEGSDATVMLNGVAVPTFPTFIRNTDPGSVIGIPGLSVPIGTTPEGLPVGLEFDGRAWGDRQLLSLGLAREGVMAR